MNTSDVEYYSKIFPKVFNKSLGSKIWSEDGIEYLDFFSGAGSASFGHNEPNIKKEVIDYMKKDGLIAGLDMDTSARNIFIKALDRYVPKNKNGEDIYKIQFPGPGGTNAVDAAVKLARKVTGKTKIISFSGAYHGHSIGAVALTASRSEGSFNGYNNDVGFLPYGNKKNKDFAIESLINAFEDPMSGFGSIAAVILERFQGEGGIEIAENDWLNKIEELCKKHNALLILDDIQAGCFRTGAFFSFEEDDIEPDIILMSKAISGIGMPLSILLMKKEHDVWSSGEHTGTYRGNQLAFIAGAAALNLANKLNLEQIIKHKGEFIDNILKKYSEKFKFTYRGRGLMWGIVLENVTPEGYDNIIRRCFENKLIIENAGRNGQVIKIMPNFFVSEDELFEGFEKLFLSIDEEIKNK